MNCKIKVLKSKTSSSYDEISNKIIKVGCVHISKPLAYILNMSLTQGIFPNRLKYSILQPICKNGDNHKFQITDLFLYLRSSQKLWKL
jgi:hypothetical protein